MAGTEKLISIPLSDAPDQPEASSELAGPYQDFERERLVPLWTQIGELMPAHPRPSAVPMASALKCTWATRCRRLQPGSPAGSSSAASATARVQATARLWGDIWHVDGVGRLMRNELFRAREPDDLSRADWLYGV